MLAGAVGGVRGGTDGRGQQTMARAVADAAAGGEHLLVQAGTGTGKSLAYLIPALLVDGPVVVSTATLALQSQLVDHDLPRLADSVEPLLRRRPTFAVLKGRHHYACLAKLDNLDVDEPADRVPSAARAERPRDPIARTARRVRSLGDSADHERRPEGSEGLAGGRAEAQPGRLPPGRPAAIREALTLLDGACRRILAGL